MTTGIAMITRTCPVCADRGRGRIFAEAVVDFQKLDRFAFASRKLPEYMHLRLLECAECDVLYADPVPPREFLEAAYEGAAFDAGNESRFAARTYGKLVDRFVARLPSKSGAIDIGTGDGAFLTELLRRGFTGVRGVEPSVAPVQAADPAVRHLILNKPFRAEEFPPGSLGLVTCFQTIEHLMDPLEFVRAAHRLLVPGGALLLVGHNRRAVLAKILGKRSPIFDVEHMQLFSQSSVRRLFQAAGFADVEVRWIVNGYPLRYWTRLAPLPGGLKKAALSFLDATRLGGLSLAMPVGNLAVVGFKS